MNRKVLVIGLDGATFNVIKPLVLSGKLPCLAHLMKEGVYGNLRSTIPPASMPAWPSFITGKNPGKHGLYDFLKRTPDDYRGRLISSRDLKAETLWDILSDSGKKCVVINFPGTYPPQKINGCIISGMLTPEGVNYVYPSNMKKELEEKGYIVSPDLSGCFGRVDILYNKLLLMEHKRKDITIHLMKLFDWDLFMILIRGTDIIQHYMWGVKDKIFKYYQEIDNIIADIICSAEKNINIIILSDHGFGLLKRYFHVNKYLNLLGLLYYKRIKSHSTKDLNINNSLTQEKKNKNIREILYRIKITQEMLENLIDKFKLNIFKNYSPVLIRKLYSIIPKSDMTIDWTKTKAAFSSFFSTENQSIIINLKDRYHLGIVEYREYEDLRNFIIEELRKLKDPQTNNKIVEKVFKREELYHGPYLREAPDIIMLLTSQYKATRNLRVKKVISSIPRSRKGSHRLHGIFIAKGPDICKGKQIKNAEIIDVTPTILYLMEINIPKDMDGRILKEIFRDSTRLASKYSLFCKNDEDSRARIS